MNDKYIASGIRCPIYKGETPGAVFCDGGDGETIRLTRSNKKMIKLHIKQFCKKDFDCCRVYRMVNGK